MSYKYFFFVLMLWCLLASSAFSTMVEADKTREVPHHFSKSTSTFSEMYSIRVDKRIELLTAVQLFTNWAEIGIWKQSYQYKEDMLNFFQPYSDHKAVTLCEDLIMSDFSYDAPVSFMMYLSDPPELKVVTPFSEYHINRAGSLSALEEFVEALRSFYIESKFEEFWNLHQNFYNETERLAYQNISLGSTVETLEDYFGVRQHGYHVILAPLFRGYYGGQIKVNDSLDIYAFLGPWKIEGNTPVFGAALFHEFAHSFINPLTDEHLKEYIHPERLYEPIKAKMTSMGYDTWSTMINEHIVRAIEIKMLGREEDLSYEESKGFIYIRDVYDLLSKYDRDSYRSFREFYPEIVNLFNAISEPKPFIGTPLGIGTITGTISILVLAIIIIEKKRRHRFKAVERKSTIKPILVA